MSIDKRAAKPRVILNTVIRRIKTERRRISEQPTKSWKILSVRTIVSINLILIVGLLAPSNYIGIVPPYVPGIAHLPYVHAAPRYFETMIYDRPKPPKPHRFVPLIYSGNPYLPEVALTFDDGPSPVYTPQILAILQHFHVPGTFFGIGRQVASWPRLVKQELAQGNEVGDHTWDHADLVWLSNASIYWEIQSTYQELGQVGGKTPVYFRPPYGAFNANVLAQAKKLHVMTVLWNIDPTDWARPGTSYIVNVIERNMHNGSIVLMHDGGGDRSQTVAALPSVITWLLQHHYRIVSLQQMIDDLAYVPPVKHHNFPLLRSRSVIPAPSRSH